MSSRRSSEATNQELMAWRARVSDWRDLEDLWIVGGPRIMSLPSSRGLSFLFVRDVIEPDVRRLAVSAQRVSAAQRNITLDLPDEAACARLIRDPFRVAVAAPSNVAGAFAPQSNLVFDASGTKLYARSTHNRIIAY